MKTFSQYASTICQEESDYYSAIALLSGKQDLNENFLAKLTAGVRSKLEFIKTLASNAQADLQSIVELFKDSRVFKFFNSIRFDLAKLFNLIKVGFSSYVQIQKVIAEYVANTKVGQWTKQALDGLDAFLQKHPMIKRIGGVAVAGILLYIWLNMSFTGDFNYDFDFTDILRAVSGSFSLAQLFAGPEGVRMLLLFATGVIGLSFPWPGPTHVKFAIALINGIKTLVKNRR